MPRPSARLGTALAVPVLLALAACTAAGEPTPSPGAADSSASVPTTGPPAGAGATTVPTFTPCGRTPADASRTNLRPSALTDADRALAGDRAEDIPDGTLIVEAATEIDVRDGILAAGVGFDIAIGESETESRVADSTVPDAPVSLTVLDSPSSGRRVAFVEIRLDPAPPVRWVEERTLGILTDSGDGGFLALGGTPAGLSPDAADAALNDSFAATFPHRDEASSVNVCLVRATDGQVDGVLFHPGWGDGFYPTYLGVDADGDVVSVVSVGLVVPWGLSGLPGEPPPAEDVGP